MSGPTPYQTIEERLTSVETKTDRLVQDVDAARIENQTAFKELRNLVAENDASMRADTKEMESRLRSEIKDTEGKLRADIKDAEEQLRTEINRSETRMHDHMNTNTNTVLSHVRVVVAIMVPVSLGVLGLLAKVIFDSG